jgi:MoaA/NifB/PqqE/SkfB family radical SAM enzyme
MSSPSIKWMMDHVPAELLQQALRLRVQWRQRSLRHVELPASDLPQETVLEYLANREFAPGTLLCYAPRNSLYFARNGQVQACCYSRDAPLGRYPEQSIQSIWEGAARLALQERIACHDLSGGCQLCKQALMQGAARQVPARQYDYAASEQPLQPTRMDFELDNTCNLECVMCSGEFSSAIRKNREMKPALSNPYDEAFFEELSGFLPALKVANFLGGEPFLIAAYYRIWDELLRVNPSCVIRLQTNASIWNARVERLLHTGRFHIAVSLDAAEPGLLSSIRQNADAQRVFDNLARFAAYARKRGTFLTLSVCPMAINWGELPALLELANRHGASWHLNTVMQPLHLALWAQPSAVLEEAEASLSRYRPSARTFLESRNREVYKVFLVQLSAWKQAAAEREAGMRALRELSLSQLTDLLNSPGLGGRIASEPLRAHLAALLSMELKGLQPERAKRVLVRFLSLPFSWMEADGELLQGTKFMDKARTYLLDYEHA